MFNNETNTIERNFSRYASTYDRFCNVQTDAATFLITLIDASSPEVIADIGCGTGGYTSLLRQKYPEAQFIAIDNSSEMIRVAQYKLGHSRIDYIEENAETVRLENKIDIITSNASVHWFSDFEVFVKNYSSFLSPGGLMAFSYFGPSTFCELSRIMTQIHGQGSSLSATSFLKKEQLQVFLRRHLDGVRIEEKRYFYTYASIKDLLRSIKYTGTRGTGCSSKNIFWTHKKLERIAEKYMDIYGAIRCTYQCYFCYGKKYD